MGRTTTHSPRPLDVRIVLAALAISALAASPPVAFAEATHPAKTTISADPNDNDYYYNVGDPGAGGGGG